MSWFKRRPRKPLRFGQPAIDFLGEQDGPPERELKTVLSSLLRNEPAVQAAYLARITYPASSTPQVALCLRTLSADNSRLISTIARLFSEAFSREESLDIVILKPEDEILLQTVCLPFFRRN